MSIYELYGRKVEELEQEIVNHRETIKVLAGVKAGTIDPARLTVDVQTWSWALQPEPAVPAESPVAE